MFPKPSANIAQTQEQDSSDRISRWAARSAKLIGAAAVIGLFASAHTFADAAENLPRMTQEQHACAVVMGLHRPGDLYDTCIRSLNKTLSELVQARLVSSDRTVCAQEALKPGTPAFATCVVNAEQSPADASRYAAIVPIR